MAAYSKLLFLLCFLVLQLSCTAQAKTKIQLDETRPKPIDSLTAIQIAISEWLPLYGKKIFKKRPFIATMKGDSIWVVKGTLKKGYVGGTPYIEINRNSGSIIEITHTK